MWNPYKTDTIGEIKSVLYKEVSLIQGCINYDLSHNIARREINSSYIIMNIDS